MSKPPSGEADVHYQPYKKLVVHELIERRFPDFVDDAISQIRAMTPPGQPMLTPVLNWCDGVVFSITPFNPNSDVIIAENLLGNIHYAAVVFAVKEKFDPELKRGDVVVKLVNQSSNRNFLRLAAALKTYSTAVKIPEVKA